MMQGKLNQVAEIISATLKSSMLASMVLSDSQLNLIESYDLYQTLRYFFHSF